MDARLCRRRVILKIILSQKQRQALKDHAQNYLPYESCALLFGKKNNDTVAVSELFLTKNIDQSPVNFTISNDDLIQGYSEAEKLGMDVVGVFHSHPHSEAIPSQTDQKFMQINPVVWVIYSGTKKDFQAFLLDDGIIYVDILES